LGLPLVYLTVSKTSVMIFSSPMPPPAALGCCAPDLGKPYIASIVRSIKLKHNLLRFDQFPVAVLGNSDFGG
jgi:hypothetical protein